MVTDGRGLPLGLHLTPGPQHEATHLAAVCEQVALPRRPHHLIADRGYDSRRVRIWLRQRRIRAVIPRRRLAAGRRNRRRGRPPQIPAVLYAQRNAVERFFGWLKEHRRIATRFEKLADAYLDMVRLACIKRLLNHLFSDTP